MLGSPAVNDRSVGWQAGWACDAGFEYEGPFTVLAWGSGTRAAGDGRLRPAAPSRADTRSFRPISTTPELYRPCRKNSDQHWPTNTAPQNSVTHGGFAKQRHSRTPCSDAST